jgi:hypothetical protein
MRRTATSIRLLLSASVLLVVVGACPAAAAPSPTGGPDGEGLAAFEWYRLSQVNTSVSGERLWSLRRDGSGRSTPTSASGSRRPTSRRAGASGAVSGD